VTEDNHIARIRAVLSDPMLDEAMMLDQVNAILDSAAPQPIVAVGQELLEPLVSTATTARKRVVHITQTPAPRVWFPGDVVPRGAAAMNEDGDLVAGAHRVMAIDGPQVELATLSPEEWQAAVDRACGCRARAGRPVL
jgi:hypothetical protein